MLLIKLLANVPLNKQHMMANVLGFLSVMWKIQMEFLALDFSLGQPWLLQILRHDVVEEKALFHSVIPFKYINQINAYVRMCAYIYMYTYVHIHFPKLADFTLSISTLSLYSKL